MSHAMRLFTTGGSRWDSCVAQLTQKESRRDDQLQRHQWREGGFREELVEENIVRILTFIIYSF